MCLFKFLILDVLDGTKQSQWAIIIIIGLYCQTRKFRPITLGNYSTVVQLLCSLNEAPIECKTMLTRWNFKRLIHFISAMYFYFQLYEILPENHLTSLGWILTFSIFLSYWKIHEISQNNTPTLANWPAQRGKLEDSNEDKVDGESVSNWSRQSYQHLMQTDNFDSRITDTCLNQDLAATLRERELRPRRCSTIQAYSR